MEFLLENTKEDRNTLSYKSMCFMLLTNPAKYASNFLRFGGRRGGSDDIQIMLRRRVTKIARTCDGASLSMMEFCGFPGSVSSNGSVRFRKVENEVWETKLRHFQHSKVASFRRLT